MKEPDNCKFRHLYVPPNTKELPPECIGCQFENVCQELQDQAYRLIQDLGLHKKIEDPFNVANIIKYFENKGVNCETFTARMQTLKPEVMILEGLLTKDKEFKSTYIRFIHNLEAAKK